MPAFLKPTSSHNKHTHTFSAQLVLGLVAIDSPHPRSYTDPACFTSAQSKR